MQVFCEYIYTGYEYQQRGHPAHQQLVEFYGTEPGPDLSANKYSSAQYTDLCKINICRAV